MPFLPPPAAKLKPAPANCRTTCCPDRADRQPCLARYNSCVVARAVSPVVWVADRPGLSPRTVKSRPTPW